MIAQIREQIADERISEFLAGMSQLGFTEQEILSLLEKRHRERGMIFYGTEQASGRMQRPDKKLRQLYCTEKSRSESGARPVHRLLGPNGSGQNDHHQTAQRSASADLGHDHRGRRTAGTLHAQHRQLPARPRLSERLDEDHGRHRLFLGFLQGFRPRQGNRNVQNAAHFPARPSENAQQGHEGKGSAYSDHEPQGAALCARRADRRRRPGRARLHLKHHSRKLQRGRFGPALDPSDR